MAAWTADPDRARRQRRCDNGDVGHDLEPLELLRHLEPRLGIGPADRRHGDLGARRQGAKTEAQLAEAVAIPTPSPEQGVPVTHGNEAVLPARVLALEEGADALDPQAALASVAARYAGRELEPKATGLALAEVADTSDPPWPCETLAASCSPC